MGLLQLAGPGPPGAHSPWKVTMGAETLSSSSRTPGSVGWSMYRWCPVAPGSCVSVGWRVRPTLTTKASPGAVSAWVLANASTSSAHSSCPPSLPDPPRGLPAAAQPRHPPSPARLCPPQGASVSLHAPNHGACPELSARTQDSTVWLEPVVLWTPQKKKAERWSAVGRLADGGSPGRPGRAWLHRTAPEPRSSSSTCGGRRTGCSPGGGLRDPGPTPSCE